MTPITTLRALMLALLLSVLLTQTACNRSARLSTVKESSESLDDEGEDSSNNGNSVNTTGGTSTTGTTTTSTNTGTTTTTTTTTATVCSSTYTTVDSVIDTDEYGDKRTIKLGWNGCKHNLKAYHNGVLVDFTLDGVSDSLKDVKPQVLFKSSPKFATANTTYSSVWAGLQCVLAPPPRILGSPAGPPICWNTYTTAASTSYTYHMLYTLVLLDNDGHVWAITYNTYNGAGWGDLTDVTEWVGGDFLLAELSSLSSTSTEIKITGLDENEDSQWVKYTHSTGAITTSL